MRQSVAAAVLAGGLVLAGALPAAAAVRGRIVGVQAHDGTLQVVLSAAGIADTETIDPASVHLTLDGASLPVTVQSATSVRADVVRKVVLAIDISGSMVTNNRIGAARQAALAYLAAVPADVQVGLITISDTATLLVPPTLDRGRIRSVVPSLQAHGNTALYDAVKLAVGVLGKDGDRSVLVLSDGQDDGSRTSLASDVTELSTAKIPVNAVLLGDVGAQQSLTALSNAAGGRVVTAVAAPDLTRSFQEAARASTKDVVVSAPIPDRYDGGSGTVTVTAIAAGQTITDTALAVDLASKAVADRSPQSFGPQAVKPLSGPFRHKALLYVGLLALFLGLGALLAFALNGIASRPPTMRGRLSPYVDTSGPRRPQVEPRGVRETALGLADEIVKRRGLEEALAHKLDAGGVPLKPSEWLILHIGIALVLPLLVLLVTDLNPVLTVLAVLVGILGPLGYLAVKARMRTRAFLAQLPDTLQLVSGSLSAGYSLPQAIDAVVRQGTAPMADELRKALVEARLGAPLEDALDDVADRMQSKDFGWVVMAIRVQRQVGGNLAEVLATTAATLRERERLRRQVQVLSAEGRLSAAILFALPVTFALYLLVARPSYMRPLYTDPLGLVMLAGMAILLTVGGFWLRKVVKVEV